MLQSFYSNIATEVQSSKLTTHKSQYQDMKVINVAQLIKIDLTDPSSVDLKLKKIIETEKCRTEGYSMQYYSFCRLALLFLAGNFPQHVLFIERTSIYINSRTKGHRKNDVEKF